MLFDKRKLFKLYKVVLFAVIFFIISVSSISANAEESISFKGEGTKENPFLISNYEDLCLLRNQVNSGVEYKDIYFKQTEDINIESETWLPIGVSESNNYFYGVYDGGGYTINDLCINGSKTNASREGLFGCLGGKVVNLKVENAIIYGEECAIIAAYSDGNAVIMNCYVSGTLYGSRIGGIAYNFDNGIIVNCISDVELRFPNSVTIEQRAECEKNYRGGILATAPKRKIYSCFTTAEQVMPEAYRSKTSKIVTEEEISTNRFLNRINIGTAFSQELFGKHNKVTLMQWELNDEAQIIYSEKTNLLKIISWTNEFLPLIILFPITMWIIYKMRWKKEVFVWGKEKDKVIAVLIISGIIAFFNNCAMLSKYKEVLTVGNFLFLITVNTLFLSCLLTLIENIKIDRQIVKNKTSIFWVMFVTFILEVLQFDIVPRYDSALYYGSLVEGAKLFRVDLFTYIGAFVCWKWIHGTALLIAPFEFLFPGQMIGVYIANIIITEVTIFIFYKLIIEMFKNLKSATAAIFSFILILCPYQLGMFTYFCLDTHLVYYAIWLLYAYKRKNNYLIAFCGFLMCFTKITGLVFYTVFLIGATVTEIIQEYKSKKMFCFSKWFHWEKKLLWISPLLLYGVRYMVGDFFVIQHFDSNHFAKIGIKSVVSLGNTLIQSYGFAFRWLFCLIIILAILRIMRIPQILQENIYEEAMPIIVATIISCTMIVLMLLIYNSDAECPRYTALMNVAYAILVPCSVLILFEKYKNRTIIGVILVVLLFVQTYCTIDPAILLNNVAVDTGTNKLYRLALKNDNRPGMNIGWNFSYGYTTIGDIYAYNIEYNVYNDLIGDALSEIVPDEQDVFYVLDLPDYELHLNGVQYKIFWNKRLQKMTYDGNDESSILLQEKSIATDELYYRVNNDASFEDEFYLIVPARIPEKNALEYLLENQYEVVEEYHPRSIYGTMSVYYMRR